LSLGLHRSRRQASDPPWPATKLKSANALTALVAPFAAAGKLKAGAQTIGRQEGFPP